MTFLVGLSLYNIDFFLTFTEQFMSHFLLVF